MKKNLKKLSCKNIVWAFFVVLFLSFSSLQLRAEYLNMELQTRDSKGQVTVEKRSVESSKIGIVTIGTWHRHWCSTATATTDSIVRRTAECLSRAHSLGISVIRGATSTIRKFPEDSPQRLAVKNLPKLKPPRVGKQIKLNHQRSNAFGECMCCEQGKCEVPEDFFSDVENNGNHPALNGCLESFGVTNCRELYSLCVARGLEYLIYVGAHSDMCVFLHPTGMAHMKEAGIECLFARDIADTFSTFSISGELEPGQYTEKWLESLEKAGVPTINLYHELNGVMDCDEHGLVDYVLMAPSGKENRPFMLSNEVSVFMWTPTLAEGCIYYKVDEQGDFVEPPMYEAELGSEYNLYKGPIKIKNSSYVTAISFKDGRRVSKSNIGCFV